MEQWGRFQGEVSMGFAHLGYGWIPAERSTSVAGVTKTDSDLVLGCLWMVRGSVGESSHRGQQLAVHEDTCMGDSADLSASTNALRLGPDLPAHHLHLSPMHDCVPVVTRETGGSSGGGHWRL